MAYNKHILEHFETPRNVGGLDVSSKDVGACIITSQASGNVLRLHIGVECETVTTVKFKSYGCGTMIATCSYVTELMRGSRLSALAQISIRDISTGMSLPKEKIHCAILMVDAMKAVIADYERKHLQK